MPADAPRRSLAPAIPPHDPQTLMRQSGSVPRPRPVGNHVTVLQNLLRLPAHILFQKGAVLVYDPGPQAGLGRHEQQATSSGFLCRDMTPINGWRRDRGRPTVLGGRGATAFGTRLLCRQNREPNIITGVVCMDAPRLQRELSTKTAEAPEV